MTIRRVLIGFLLFALLAFLMIVHLATQQAHAESRAEWFKSLKQPMTGASCCDISDCKRTKANWEKGQWWADVQGVWTPIPKDKILTDKASIDGEAYVCSGFARRIYCFIKPSPGA